MVHRKSLKQKAVGGLLWSSIDILAAQSINFIFGVILARLLSVREFGLVGMMTVFIALSDTLINSGFGNALVHRGKKCSNSDYSTVFFFNIVVSASLALLLIIFSGAIAQFFHEPQLEMLLQVFSVVLIINAFSIVQRTIMVQAIDFKTQTKISIISAVVGGIVAVSMAFTGWGVWSLIALQIVKQGVSTILLWSWNSWRPGLIFSLNSFKELFGFGNKLLISSLIDTIYRQIYYLIVGKFYSAQDLGFYTKADNFKSLPASNISNIISKVTFPVLVEMREDKLQLKRGYRKMISSVALISFLSMLGLVAISEQLTIALLGEKWRNSIEYLQLLSFAALLYPIQTLNMNILKVMGRTDLFLKIEIIKKSLAVPVIFIGIFLGIKAMLLAAIAVSIIEYYINSWWSGHFVDYSIWQQIRDFLPSLLFAAIVSFVVYILGHLLNILYLYELLIQLTAAVVLIFSLGELTKLGSYNFIKSSILEQFNSRT